jgi:hypothetical protein
MDQLMICGLYLLIYLQFHYIHILSASDLFVWPDRVFFTLLAYHLSLLFLIPGKFRDSLICNFFQVFQSIVLHM